MVTSASSTRKSAMLAALTAAALGCSDRAANGDNAGGADAGTGGAASSHHHAASGAGGDPSGAAGGAPSTASQGGAGGASSSASSAGGGGASASSASSSSSSSSSAASSSSSTGGGGSLRVLFVGNSFTFEDDVPGLVQALAAAKGQSLEVGMVASAGETLQQHYESGDILPALESATWDIVVLQEHPTMPFDAEDDFHEYATLLDAEVKAHGASTMLYVTWVDEAQTAADQDYVTASYVEIAQQLGADVAPVGEAWKNAFIAQPGCVLHDTDGFHSNDKGAYLAACVFYAALYGATPEGAPSPSPTVGADAPFLQSTAWATWQEGGWTFP